MLEAGYEADELLLRVDSGHDSADFIEAAETLGIKYLVKRNPRRENELQLLDSIRSCEEPECPRPGKTVCLGTQQTTIAAVKADMSALQTANQTRDAAISALQADNEELKSQLSSLLSLLNGGKEGQVLTKGKDGSLVWMDLKAQDTEVKTLALEAGWNLVAMPGRWLFEESDQALLDEIKIYTYDRETQVYTHADGLKPLTSYWFYVKEPCTIHFAVIADDAE